MRIFKKLATMFGLWLEWVKIPLPLIEHPLRLKSDSTLQVFFLDTGEITVSGYYKRYTRRYVSKWAFPKTFVVYHVHGIMTSADATDRAKEIARTPIILPRLLPWYVPDKVQLDHAMLAYIAIVLERIKEEKQ